MTDKFNLFSHTEPTENLVRDLVCHPLARKLEKGGKGIVHANAYRVHSTAAFKGAYSLVYAVKRPFRAVALALFKSTALSGSRSAVPAVSAMALSSVS